MATAEIHGKTPFSYSEDMLTADVFSAFRYLPADTGIIGFLRSIKGVETIIPVPDETSTCEFYFWPLGRLCRREPDLLLELNVAGKVYHIVIEAKYMSGPSDTEDLEKTLGEEIVKLGNQLADQYIDVLNGKYLTYRGTKRDQSKELESEIGDRLELYLTAHLFRPQEELERCCQCCPASSERLFWTNWHHVFDYLVSAKDALSQFPYDRIVDDLCVLLDQKQFSTFQGVMRPPDIEIEYANGSFWHLITEPPEIELQGVSGSFWHLITKPPEIELQGVSGSFWKT